MLLLINKVLLKYFEILKETKLFFKEFIPKWKFNIQDASI